MLRPSPGLLGFFSPEQPDNLANALEKEVAAHSGPLAWEIPWTEEPGRLQSMGS